MKAVIIFILNAMSVWLVYFLYSVNIFLINGSGAIYNKNIEYWKIGFGLVGILHILLIWKYFNSKLKYFLVPILIILYFYFGVYKL